MLNIYHIKFNYISLNVFLIKLIFIMKDLNFKISWKELFFPVLNDLKNINSETDTASVSSNNWNLANDKDDFKIIFEQIKENRASAETEHNIIILK